MTLFALIFLVVFVCLIVWVVQAWNPPAPIRNIVFGLTLLLLVLLLLGLFGVFPGVTFGGPVRFR